MEDKFLYGAAYYSEYMPYDRIEKDFQMMKAAGMNVIRIAESTWSTLEPHDGIFDFSHVDRMLEEAKKADLMVIIGTPTYAVPSWLVKKDPDVMVTMKFGQPSYGPRQLMNLWNPTFRFHADRVIRELISHTANHPQVIGFQIDNETKHYGNYGAQCHELFKEYLKETYKTTDNLNRTFNLHYWSNAIHDWDDLPDLKLTINHSLRSAYEKFIRTLAADYLKWQSDIVKEYRKEGQFITQNFDFDWAKALDDPKMEAYSYGVQGDICHQEACDKALDLASCDIYHPAQDDETGREIAFGGDEIRSLRHEPYLVMESQAQGFKGWTPYPGQLRLDTYAHLASGAMGQMYWNWMSIHNAAETYWKGVLNHDLLESPIYEEISEIGNEIKRVGADNLCITKKNRIVLVEDPISKEALNNLPIDAGIRYNDVVRWMYDTLYEMNLECDVVDVSVIEPSDYDVVIVPALYCAAESFIGKLEKFVKEGGVLISSFKSFFCNEIATVYQDLQPHGLTEVFGANYQQFSAPGRTTVAGGKSVKGFMELVNTTTAKAIYSYEHKYWGRYAAATENGYGNGKAFYIGCFMDGDLLKDIYRKAFEAAGITLPEQENGICYPLVLRSGINKKGALVHYLMNFSEEVQNTVCPYDHAVELLTGKTLQKGDVISLDDWGVCVLAENV